MDVDASFRQQILELVARIPAGRVMTYGQLALLAGHPGAARQAGQVMHSLLGGPDNGNSTKGEPELPWQRVINAQGRVSTHKVGFGDLQEGLLRAEGVALDSTGRCDLSKVQWWPAEQKDAPPESLF